MATTDHDPSEDEVLERIRAASRTRTPGRSTSSSTTSSFDPIAADLELGETPRRRSRRRERTGRTREAPGSSDAANRARQRVLQETSEWEVVALPAQASPEPVATSALDIDFDFLDDDAPTAGAPAAAPRRSGPARARRQPTRAPRSRPQLPARPALPPLGKRARQRGLVAVLVLILVAGVAAALLSSGSSQTETTPPATARKPSSDQVQRERQQQQMRAAAARGDYNAAIALADALKDQSSKAAFANRAATIVVRRALSQANRGNLPTAKGLLSRAQRRYNTAPGAAAVRARIKRIEQQRKTRARARARAAARKRAAARRRAAAAAAAAARRSSPAPSSGGSSAAPSAPATPVAPTPSAPSTGGGGGRSSGGGSSSSGGGGGSTSGGGGGGSKPAPAPSSDGSGEFF